MTAGGGIGAALEDFSKQRGIAEHSPSVSSVAMLPGPMPAELSEPRLALAAGCQVTEVYRTHADFVWRTLQHLGVPASDLEDVLQEVFVVVHQKLAGFEGRSTLETWLFGICLRRARAHRRRAYFRRERPVAELPEATEEQTPEELASRARSRALLARLLAELDPAARATFVLFEVEGQSTAEIAELTAVPVGTVHSRLHATRKKLARLLRRHRALSPELERRGGSR